MNERERERERDREREREMREGLQGLAPSSSSIILTPSRLRSLSSLWLAREMQPFRAREEVTTHVAGGERREGGRERGMEGGREGGREEERKRERERK